MPTRWHGYIDRRKCAESDKARWADYSKKSVRRSLLVTHRSCDQAVQVTMPTPARFCIGALYARPPTRGVIDRGLNVVRDG